MSIIAKLIKIIVITVIVGILGVILFSVSMLAYEDLQPTALQQLLRFAGLPTDMTLPSYQVGQRSQHDYQPVKDILLRQFPIGTSRASITDFLNSHGAHCDQVDAEIYCTFEHERFPCKTTVSLRWLFSSDNALNDILISEGDACL
ncbi:MAG TPA: hypothetical protein VFT66_22570 [Roseiflexaceae bacterium]|jgi:hypothetical protein|nr:hypothetical protein [Roseiflexaceae bacterium]